MGNLAAFGVSTSIISTSQGPLTLRGLSLVDLKYLIAKHATPIGHLLAKLPQRGEKETVEAYLQRRDVLDLLGMDLVLTMLDMAPDLCGGIIACATDDRGDAAAEEVAMNLPLGLQITALVEIANATFKDGGGAKKVIETVAALLRKNAPETAAS